MSHWDAWIPMHVRAEVWALDYILKRTTCHERLLFFVPEGRWMHWADPTREAQR